MNTNELQERLAAEGCDPFCYAIGERGRANDAYCLTQNGGEWQVYYTERGVDQAPMFTSASEEEACAYFFNFIMSFRHDHWVGFVRTEAATRAFEDNLDQLGVAHRRDVIRYKSHDDLRFRVFVEGKAIFAVRAAFDKLPQSD
jgi:hypothetical protein